MPSTIPRCIRCRYDLTGVPSRCPECGWDIDPEVVYLDDVELIARQLQKPAPPSLGRRLLATYAALVLCFVALLVMVMIGAIIWMLSKS